MEKQIKKLKNHYIVCGGGMTGRHVIAELVRNKELVVLIEQLIRMYAIIGLSQLGMSLAPTIVVQTINIIILGAMNIFIVTAILFFIFQYKNNDTSVLINPEQIKSNQ